MEIDQSQLIPEITDQYTIENNTFLATPKDDDKDRIEIEIGDVKQPDFLPQLKLMRWDNEVNVSLRLVHDETDPTLQTVASPVVSSMLSSKLKSAVQPAQIQWVGEKVQSNFYAIDPSDTLPEGGYEIEVILNEKPDTNVVQFTIQDKGVRYEYQPALTQDEIDEGDIRPDNVIGSYAVYASEQKQNIVGGKEYKCGKIGHIYRPKIVDAEGTEVWGELLIENGILSVTIPQDFLDNAVYPVKHAAGLTFGYMTIGTAGYTPFSGNIRAYGPWTPASNGKAVSVSVYNSANDNPGVTFCIYNDSSGYPGSMLAETTGHTSTVISWNTFNLTTSPSVSAGTYYWPGGEASGTDFTTQWDTINSVSQYYKANTYSAGNLPNPFPAGATQAAYRAYSIYITYNLAATTNSNFFIMFP